VIYNIVQSNMVAGCFQKKVLAQKCTLCSFVIIVKTRIIPSLVRIGYTSYIMKSSVLNGEVKSLA